MAFSLFEDLSEFWSIFHLIDEIQLPFYFGLYIVDYLPDVMRFFNIYPFLLESIHDKSLNLVDEPYIPLILRLNIG